VPKKKTGESCGSLVECELFECEGGVCTASPWVCSDVWGAGT
jgi:hypothetical protein